MKLSGSRAKGGVLEIFNGTEKDLCPYALLDF